MSDRYAARGVSSDKKEVHQAIRNLDKGLYPKAFCKILPDVLTGSPEHALIMHADTAGTKPILAYLYWKTTGDLSVWKHIAQDALVMNLDDMACAGMTEGFVLSSTIARNKTLIPGNVLEALIEGTAQLVEEWNALGLNIQHAGGETADVGDLVRTIDVGFTVMGRMERKQVIEIQPKDGDAVVSLASYGQTNYEDQYNSGIGCNGLTSARHDLFNKSYLREYPETYDPLISSQYLYSGKLSLTDTEPSTGIDYGRLALSPTRTYLPILKELLPIFRHQVHGIIHLTGGAHTKVLKFLKGHKVVKNQMLPVPPLFRAIQRQSGTDWREMYTVFNMGSRMDLFMPPSAAEEFVAACRPFGLEATISGFVQASKKAEVVLETEFGTFSYTE